MHSQQIHIRTHMHAVLLLNTEHKQEYIDFVQCLFTDYAAWQLNLSIVYCTVSCVRLQCFSHLLPKRISADVNALTFESSIYLGAST